MQPPGARARVREKRDTLRIDIPPASLASAERVGLAGFAVTWNVGIGVWTASALAAGSVFAAAFSIPFWAAGALPTCFLPFPPCCWHACHAVCKSDQQWVYIQHMVCRLQRGQGSPQVHPCRGARTTRPQILEHHTLWPPAEKYVCLSSSAHGNLTDCQAPSSCCLWPAEQDAKPAVEGRTRDLRAAQVVVTGFVNGTPRTEIKLLEGFREHRFGSGTRLPRPWCCRRLNDEIHMQVLGHRNSACH